MKLSFSHHALEKMGDRNLSKDKVVKTVNQPDLVRHSYGFREELYKKFDKNHLKVVIKRFEDRIVIVTAHWVAKVKKK